MSKVSVCIPIYNVEQYIGRCIEYVISETLAQIMKRISSSYVYYYNHKYGRIN